MAHGLPDYYRGVDIAYQALARLMVRPTYGAAESVFDDIDVVGNEETELCSVSGKGMIYGGVLRVDPDFTQALCRPYLYIDDQRIASTPFHFMNSYHYVKEHCHGIYLLKYDNITFTYVVAFSRGFTFESSFKVTYKELYGESPTVSFRVNYALIE